MLLKITYMCYFIIILPVSATLQYDYISDKKTLSEAHDFCMRNGSKLSGLQENVTLASQECLDNCIGEDLWTSTFAAPYLSILGCFNLIGNPTFFDLNDTSVIDCQNWCYNASAFAVSNRRCSCIEKMSDLGETVNAALCNISCDGVYCGGNDVMNVYVTVEAEFFDNKALQTNTMDGSSCITYQCVDGFQLFKETDCNTTERTDVTCSTFFSCTFEPGESCFLFQNKSDKIKWTITNETTEFGPKTAYQGSYFAFINVTDVKNMSGGKATLISNVKINAKYGNLWCLRFRYQLPDQNTNASLEVILKREQRKTIQTFTFGKFQEWNYTELQINLSGLNETYILFEFTSGTYPTHLALDDVTLTQGSCGDTLADVLKMTGSLKCGFEGNQNVCFYQSTADNFDWNITREDSSHRSTGPSKKQEGDYYSFIDSYGVKRNKGHKAELITKFLLDNENITFSMYYHMNGKNIGKLEVYLHNKSNILFQKTGKQGKEWTRFKTTTILDYQHVPLHISANLGDVENADIAIDDIQFRINKLATDTTWWSGSRKCVRDVRSYPIPHSQFGSTQCISYDNTSRWTGIVRPWQRLKGRYLGVGNPSDVLVYKSSNMTFVWEEFNSSGTRSFFCESEKQEKGTLPYQNTSVANQTNEENGTLIGGLVAGGVGILVIAIILIVVIKRKKNQRKIDNAGVTNMVYEKIDDDVIGKEDGNSNGNQQQTDRNKSSSKFLANSEQATEGEYNHLTFKQEVTTSANDVYSHVTDNQYGLHPVQKQEDDTYDHSTGLLDKGDYGAPNVTESPDLYDHAHGTEYSSLHGGPDAAARNNIEGSDTYAQTLDNLYSSANQRVQN